MLIRYIKTLAILKYHQFEDSLSDAIKQSISKCLCIDEHNNKKEQNLDEYYGKDNRYILFFFCL